MSYVLSGLGSNIDRYRHLGAALDALQGEFGSLDISRVFESEPVGFSSGRNFFNLVVGFRTDLSIGELSRWSKTLEKAQGRRHDAPKFSSRSLDIDLLLVDDHVGIIDGVHLPREEITRNAFVLRPLAELCPQRHHPLEGRSFAELWQTFDPGRQRLWPIHFEWQGGCISLPD
ncbi:2-amino-4-hydroxy-6-hydroxymethyldihydropteridine diphosphokinase [Kushneria phosphatilytica]|uniref:2-amino-4-hydroxy-6-hydroxymethyldihydropteridine diphosphokinase n=1 Tax=Kushneria phosphatilytica TaxID=657387 RepID=A0A1S1NY88_9GAMM|nr:2-amino-4-hydroxy-6-hydroxymethyldihydropteridine diphosphokinase [Kushneria phosphatilytica]OHV12743.1 2-amino-4-hydroxy-6-hydroxymethyldihydropteridine diphosphokinase [Kushneria phosphatilytica]QEL10584.1 2-amino-4-hydroxy-6-hydroxymethyldihydropteridine diphosphokinase [Kushneria phosphatilytica]